MKADSVWSKSLMSCSAAGPSLMSCCRFVMKEAGLGMRMWLEW